MPRCFGYTADGDLIDHEATIIRGVVASILDGHLTLSGVVDELNAAGITTAAGKPWQIGPLVRLLTNPRLAGLTAKSRRDRNTPAAPIISRDQHARLAAQAAARREHGPRQRAATTRLLSGRVVCVKDGAVMTGHHNPAGASYRCPHGDGQVQADLLERYVIERTIGLLDRGARTAPLVTVDALRARLAELSRHRSHVTQARRAGVMTDAEARVAWARIKKRRHDVNQEIARLQEQGDPVMPTPGKARAWWEDATAAQHRAVLDAVWDRIEIGEPTRRGQAGLDASRVHMVRRHNEVRRAAS